MFFGRILFKKKRCLNKHVLDCLTYVAGRTTAVLRVEKPLLKKREIHGMPFFSPSVPLAEPHHELGRTDLDRESSIREFRHTGTYHSKFGSRIACESIERARRIKVMRFSPHSRASCSLHGPPISASMDHWVGLYVSNVRSSL